MNNKIKNKNYIVLSQVYILIYCIVILIACLACKPHPSQKDNQNNLQNKYDLVQKKISHILKQELRISSFYVSGYQRSINGKQQKKIIRLNKPEFGIQYDQNFSLPGLVTIITVFYDKKNRIRRFILYFYEQDSFRTIEYFDAKGNLLCFLHKSSNHTGPSWISVAFFLEGKSVLINNLTDAYSNMQGDYKYTNKLPEKYVHKTIDSIIEEYPDIRKSFISGPLYKSRSLLIGDLTEVNAIDVILRNSNSKKTAMIKKLQLFDGPVEIINVDRKENIPPWGHHRWYKVRLKFRGTDASYIGYIFGAFLEPVFPLIK